MTLSDRTLVRVPWITRTRNPSRESLSLVDSITSVCVKEVRRDDATIALSLYLRLAFLGCPFTVARAPAASDTI